MVELAPHFPIGHSVNGKNITPDERMLVFLMFAAGDKTVWDMEFTYEFSTGSVIKSNAMCIQILFENFVGRHVKMPTQEEAIKEAKLFSAASGFPPIVFGAIDGTHVIVMPPKAQTILYRNRHSRLSLNILMMGGASGLIYFVKANCPGSFNDNRILRHSVLWEILEINGWLPFPGGIIIGEIFFCTRLHLSSALQDKGVKIECSGKRLMVCWKI
jgi:hypothetical protein